MSDARSSDHEYIHATMFGRSISMVENLSRLLDRLEEDRNADAEDLHPDDEDSHHDPDRRGG